MGKAKPASHTSKELQGKAFAATVNRGGGTAGLKDRLGGAAGSHARFECPMCGMNAPGEKSGKDHWDSKHSKHPFDWPAWANKLEEAGGVSTVGVNVLGSRNKLKEVKLQEKAAKKEGGYTGSAKNAKEGLVNGKPIGKQSEKKK